MATIPAGPARSAALTTRQLGAQHEQLARYYLQRMGMHFVAANIHLHKGELDLIMRDGEQLVFVEVRYRRHDTFGDAAATVTRRKQQLLRRTAALWLARQNRSLDNTLCRFDVLAITGSQLQWLPNAFDADE